MYPSHLGPGDRVDYVEPPAEGPILGYSHQAVATLLRQRQQDERPIGERINLYGYVSNNPVTLTDPSGLGELPFPWDKPPRGPKKGPLPRDVISEAERRRGCKGKGDDSSHHCWATCVYGLLA